MQISGGALLCVDRDRLLSRKLNLLEGSEHVKIEILKILKKFKIHLFSCIRQFGGLAPVPPTQVDHVLFFEKEGEG